MEYDVPPPLPDEQEFIEHRVLGLDDPAFAFQPLQPPPVDFLAPPPPEFLALAPPAEPSGAYVLPTLMIVSLPAYVELPADVVAPSSGTASEANNPRLPPSVALRAAPVASRSQLLVTLQPEPLDAMKAPLMPPWPTAAVTPAWPTDNKTPASPVIEPPAVMVNQEPPIAAPPLRAGVPQRTPGAAMVSPQMTGSIPLQVDRAATPAPPIGIAPRAPRDAILSPQATDHIPLPLPRPAKFARPLSLTRPRPAAAATLSPNEVGGAGQSSSPLPKRVPPSTSAARPDNVALGASPTKPAKKPCPIVDGQPNCD
jgi:hypothetical protein